MNVVNMNIDKIDLELKLEQLKAAREEVIEQQTSLQTQNKIIIHSLEQLGTHVIFFNGRPKLTSALQQKHASVGDEKKISAFQAELESNYNQLDNYSTQMKSNSKEISSIKEKLVKESRLTLVDLLKAHLDHYSAERNNTYQIKDKLISSDKENRDMFIASFYAMLNEYGAKGESKAVLDYIIENRSKFPGTKLQTTLNRMIVTLLDAERPIDPTATLKYAETILVRHQNQDYKSCMRELYKQINIMRIFANRLPQEERKVVSTLANALKQDVTDFICQNAYSPPNEDSYKNFSMKLKARLHSQDDVIRNPRWLSIAKNIAFTLFTVGIALGIKLAHSKITTGRASFGSV